MTKEKLRREKWSDEGRRRPTQANTPRRARRGSEGGREGRPPMLCAMFYMVYSMLCMVYRMLCFCHFFGERALVCALQLACCVRFSWLLCVLQLACCVRFSWLVVCASAGCCVRFSWLGWFSVALFDYYRSEASSTTSLLSIIDAQLQVCAAI